VTDVRLATFDTKQRLAAFAAAGACFLTSAAYAQSTDLIEVTGDLSVVTGIVDGELKSDADARVSAMGSTVLDSGFEVGAAASLRADGDMPGSLYAGGRYSSLLAGGARGLGSDSGDVFLEGAYLFARGGFGSLHIGRDAGVASRLAVTSPTIFRSIGVNDWRTDLTGLNDVHTVNDFSGQSTKLTYMPPAGFLGGVIGQLQLGLSYAPELGDCGASKCAPLNGFVTPDGAPAAVATEQAWQDVVETALYYQKAVEVGRDRLTFGVGASYVRADENNATPPQPDMEPLFGDYRSYAVGLNLGYGGLTVGGSLKSSNAGIEKKRDEDYLAFDAGVTYEAGEWNFMLGYGAADADRDAAFLLGPSQNGMVGPYRLDRETQTAQAGISYVFDQGVTLGAAAQFVDSDKADALGGPQDAAAILFESSIKF
jgi:predicted porin